MKLIKIIAIFILLTAFGEEMHNGVYIEEKEFNQALHLFNNRNNVPLEQIYEILGEPNLTPSYENSCYYIYRVTESRNFSVPKVLKQRIVKVYLDKDKLNAIKIELIDGGFNEKIPFVKKITKDVTNEKKLLNTYLANFFRFNDREKLR